MGQIEKFLCLSDREFPEFFKNGPIFYSSSTQWPSVTIFHKSQFFFGTPCMFLHFPSSWSECLDILTWDIYFVTLNNAIAMSRKKSDKIVYVRVLRNWEIDAFALNLLKSLISRRRVTVMFSEMMRQWSVCH